MSYVIVIFNTSGASPVELVVERPGDVVRAKSRKAANALIRELSEHSRKSLPEIKYVAIKEELFLKEIEYFAGYLADLALP